ncbi:MAG: alpha/beta hydrolase [Solirubrobacteraceae bacterium]
MLDSEIGRIIAELPRRDARSAAPSLSDLRDAARALIPLAGPAPECPTRRHRAPGVPPMRVYDPPGARGSCVFLHGGAFVRGDLDTHDVLCRRLALGGGTEIVAVDYRRAPEHPFPAAWDDALAAVRHAASRAGGPVCVAGDSAGGCLAAAAALDARDLVAGQLLLYPVTDATQAARSLREHADGPLLTREQVAWSWEQVRGAAAPDDPRLSPLHAGRLAGAPAAYVLTAEHDPLRDDGASYALRLRAAGVPVEHRHLAGAPHNVALLTGESALARDAVAHAAAWLRRVGERA